MKRSGFTLIELLVVIAIVSILAVSVFVALDPLTRFAEARNAKRWSDVDTILTAVHQCLIDNEGVMADCGIFVSMSKTTLGTSGLDLTTELEPYLKSIPCDPQAAGCTSSTDYSIEVDDEGIITISADSAEESVTIEVSR